MDVDTLVRKQAEATILDARIKQASPDAERLYSAWDDQARELRRVCNTHYFVAIAEWNRLTDLRRVRMPVANWYSELHRLNGVIDRLDGGTSLPDGNDDSSDEPG